MMKKKCIISVLLLLSLCLTACAAEEQPKGPPQCSSTAEKTEMPTDDTYHAGLDYPFMYRHSVDSRLTEAPDAYFLRLKNFLFRIDKETMTPELLCSRTGCQHYHEPDFYEIPRCDAYLGRVNEELLQYYDGNLYLTAPKHLSLSKKDQVLIRMDQNGKNRKVIAELPLSACDLMLHRGYAYYNVPGYDSNENYTVIVYRISLDNGTKEVVYQTAPNEGIVYMTAYGNRLYISVTSDDTNQSQFLAYHVQNGKLEKILEPTAADKMLCVIDSFLGERMIVSYYDRETHDEMQYMADLDGNNKTEIPWLDPQEDVLITSDGSHLWKHTAPGGSQTKDICEMVDENGKVLLQYPYSMSALYGTIIYGTEDHLFYDTCYHDGDYVLYAMNKHPEDGILQRQELLRIPYADLSKGILFDKDRTYPEIVDRG